ncbi:hypothetical protein V6N13_148226 [Hibiscus sabdariffa]|uniref:SHSP domain-containing protein n=1 Tax=Hibiscus sabdariffa TaxID=183260 RepID=A0ABR2TXX2_9ROSI
MKEGSTEPSCYDDFEPYCQWSKEIRAPIIQQADIVEIQLQGFKEKEVKSELGWDGFLYISGEHPMGNNKIKRFNKKIDVSNYEFQGIELKFDAGKLVLRFPCKSSATLPKFLRSAMALALPIILGVFVYKYLTSVEFGSNQNNL